MPGKALYLLALTLTLTLVGQAACCQAASSYLNSGYPTAYKRGKSASHKHSYRRHSGSFRSRPQVHAIDAYRLPPDSSLVHGALTHDAVLTALKGNQYVSLSQGADIKFDGDILRLALWRDKRADIHDQKIDAVLLARTLETQFPGVFSEFDCSFFDPSAPGRSRRALVKLSLLADFAEGRLDKEHLLQAIPMVDESNGSLAERYGRLTYKQILEESPVLEGSYAFERKELSDQLTTLKANGYDVTQATRQFFALEDLVRTRQYNQLAQAFAKTRQYIAEAVAKSEGISVATSRSLNWQR